MSQFYSVGGIANLPNKRVTSNAFSLFHSTSSNFSKIKMFPIFLSVLCVFYILDKNRKSSILPKMLDQFNNLFMEYSKFKTCHHT